MTPFRLHPLSSWLDSSHEHRRPRRPPGPGPSPCPPDPPRPGVGSVAHEHIVTSVSSTLLPAGLAHPKEHLMAALGSIDLKMRLSIAAGITDLTEVAAVDLDVPVPLAMHSTEGPAVRVEMVGFEQRLRRAVDAFEEALTTEEP